MVIPCRDEAGSIADVVHRVPASAQIIVVDNGSTDGTADIARHAGAQVVVEPRPGYGSAVAAGVVAASRPIVCTIDGDGSLAPEDLRPLVSAVLAGDDVAVGRRIPTERAAWPWHARIGTAVIATQLRSRHGLDVHDIAPVRAIRHDVLRNLAVADRGSGYPVEFLVRVARAGLRVREIDVRFAPRTSGRSKVSGTVVGSIRAGRAFLAELS